MTRRVQDRRTWARSTRRAFLHKLAGAAGAIGLFAFTVLAPIQGAAQDPPPGEPAPEGGGSRRDAVVEEANDPRVPSGRRS